MSRPTLTGHGPVTRQQYQAATKTTRPQIGGVMASAAADSDQSVVTPLNVGGPPYRAYLGRIPVMTSSMEDTALPDRRLGGGGSGEELGEDG